MKTTARFFLKSSIGVRIAIVSLLFSMLEPGYANAQKNNQQNQQSNAANAPSITQQQANASNPPSLILNPSYGPTFYVKDNTRNRKPWPYQNEREGDIQWSKRIWRTIDLREKFNHPFYYPTMPTVSRKSLFDVMKSALLKGEIHAYSDMDDEFSVKLSPGEIENLFVQIDTNHYVQDPLNPNGPMIRADVRNDLNSDQIIGYLLKEDWFFDKQRSVMDVRILGMCPLKAKKDPATDELIGFSTLFWVYFPECRPVFARNEVYNIKNDAQQNSYDDAFTKRYFSSRVVKESNVYDRYISDYATGLDALLDSDRIKNDIFLTEHDVWHF